MTPYQKKIGMKKVLNAADWSQEIVLNTSDGTELADERLYMVKTVILSKKDTKIRVCFTS